MLIIPHCFCSIIDTGSSLTYLPIEYAAGLFKELKVKTVEDQYLGKKALFALTPCDSPAPLVKIRLGPIGVDYIMSRKSLLVETDSPGVCVLKIVGSDVEESRNGSPHAILGASFLVSECAFGCFFSLHCLHP
jgi:hypothetical protein